jgi:hypothetical protein
MPCVVGKVLAASARQSRKATTEGGRKIPEVLSEESYKLRKPPAPHARRKSRASGAAKIYRRQQHRPPVLGYSPAGYLDSPIGEQLGQLDI